jgi:hypothetical protein
MKDHTDAELVEQTRGGEQVAYGVLVSRYQGHVYGLAYSLVGNWESLPISRICPCRTLLSVKGSTWRRRSCGKPY